MAKNIESEDRIEKAAILELLRTARTMKRQLKILKGIQLSDKERRLLQDVINRVEEDCKIFKI